jgi:hypothetical protein
VFIRHASYRRLDRVGDAYRYGLEAFCILMHAVVARCAHLFGAEACCTAGM